QAEDGIRDFHVTGVQTCALPISCCCSRLSLLVPAAPGCRRPQGITKYNKWDQQGAMPGSGGAGVEMGTCTPDGRRARMMRENRARRLRAWIVAAAFALALWAGGAVDHGETLAQG